MTAGRSGNCDCAVFDWYFDRLPIRQSQGIAAEALRTGYGGNHFIGSREECATNVVEVVGVVVMAEQHDIDCA
jgi:hypothetical protein